MDLIAFFLIKVIEIFKYAILARILLSWIRPTGFGAEVNRFLHELTEPLLSVFRNLLPRTGMIDLSPIIAFFALDFLQVGIISIFASI